LTTFDIMNKENNDESGQILFEPDIYDQGISYLRENPDDIESAWGDPGGWEGKGGELFGFVAPDWKDGNASAKYDGMRAGTCGCLQQIRQAKAEGFDGTEGSCKMAYWERLWDSIANDRRLPTESSDITVEDLPVFAEWQRELDQKRLQDGMVL